MLVEAPLTDNKGKFRRFVADLILLDTDFNNHLALVEFKGEDKRPSDALAQVKSFLEAIRIDNLPSLSEN
jgi:hypothetical protein